MKLNMKRSFRDSTWLKWQRSYQWSYTVIHRLLSDTSMVTMKQKGERMKEYLSIFRRKMAKGFSAKFVQILKEENK